MTARTRLDSVAAVLRLVRALPDLADVDLDALLDVLLAPKPVPPFPEWSDPRLSVYVGQVVRGDAHAVHGCACEECAPTEQAAALCWAETSTTRRPCRARAVTPDGRCRHHEGRPAVPPAHHLWVAAVPEGERDLTPEQARQWIAEHPAE